MRGLIATLALLLVGTAPGASADTARVGIAGHATYGLTDARGIAIAAHLKPLEGVLVVDAQDVHVLRCLQHADGTGTFLGNAQSIASGQYVYFRIQDYGIPILSDAIAVKSSATAGAFCQAPGAGELEPVTSTITYIA